MLWRLPICTKSFIDKMAFLSHIARKINKSIFI
jgi:hypothetical protein